MARHRAHLIGLLMSLLVVGIGGAAYGQTSVHNAAVDWIEDVQGWMNDRFDPLYVEIGARALWSALPDEVIRGPDIVSDFDVDYHLATEDFLDLIDQYFADDSPIRRLVSSRDDRSRYLASAMEAYQKSLFAQHNLLRSIADGSATVREIEYWYQIGGLWESIGKLNMLLYTGSR